MGETAAAEGVPRSTLYYWLSRKEQLDASEAVAEFYESPEGLAELHRIVGAAHFVFGQACGCGADRMCEFLDLSRLNRFVAGSHGAQHDVSLQMEGLLGAYGQEERERLAAAMTPKSIALCEDETFHPEVCLVAIEPASGFIILECYAEARDGETWTEAITAALAGLPVTVVVVASDEARGLKAHVRDGLGAQHSPDLFHCQHDLVKATARPLAYRMKAPAAAHAAAEARTERLRAVKSNYWSNPRPPGRPPLFDRYIAAAECAEQEALGELESAAAERDVVKQAIRGIGDVFHPFDLASGLRQTAEEVEARIRSAFARIDEITQHVGLSQKYQARIDKARRLVPAFRASMAFFQAQLNRTLDRLDLETRRPTTPPVISSPPASTSAAPPLGLAAPTKNTSSALSPIA